MSDVVVSVTESTTTVTVTEQDVAVAVTETNVDVSASSAGIQGATGATGVGYTGVTSTSTITIGAGLKTFTLVSGYQGAFITGMRIRAIHSDTPTYYLEGTANYVGGGTLIITVDKFNGSGSHNNWLFAVAGEVGQTGATGAQGTAGASGVISVTSPITNSGSASSAIVGIDQTLLSLTQSQVTNLTTDLANRAILNSANTFSVGGQVISNAATAVVPLAVRAVTGQSADLMQFQDSGGTVIGRLNNSAQAGFSRISAGQATISGVARLFATSAGTAEIPLAVRGLASQSANLQEWQNSSGVALATLGSGGNLFAVQLNTANLLGSLREANSGGFLRLTKATAALTNPGAGLAGIYFRDGTNAGTLKLVVRAGAAGAETTILDNIPQ
jgi:hypothetical protein